MPWRMDERENFAEWAFSRSTIEEEAGYSKYPWLISNPVAKDNQELCWRCRYLNLDWLIHNFLTRAIRIALQQEGRRKIRVGPGIVLGTLADIRSEMRGCSFCRLTWEAMCLRQSGGHVSDECLGELCVLENEARGLHGFLHPDEIIKGKTPHIYVLELSSKWPENKVWDQAGADERPPRALLQPIWEGNRTDVSLCWGRKVAPEINISVIKSWLQICLMCHSDACGKSVFQKPSIAMRFVDTRRMCIVEMMPSAMTEGYVALSYVWGRQRFMTLNSTNMGMLSNDGALSMEDERVPLTIRSAMRLCRALDERYLWVDSLCIVQDSEQKMSQILIMHSIYNSAKFAIVAASGNDAEAGLPGISMEYRNKRKSRRQQRRGRAQGTVFGNVLLPLFESTDHSYWNGRAWTYQERLLSRRLLIFSDEQVYYECAKGVYTEDIILETESHVALDRIEDTNPDTPYDLFSHSTLEFRLYAQAVQEYTCRALSYETDIENAFQGVLTPLSKKYRWVKTLACVPLYLLDIALLWVPAGKARRRISEAQCPSWAWAGWVGPAKYIDLIHIADRTLGKVKWLPAEASKGNVKTFSLFSTTFPTHLEEGWLRQILDDGEIAYINRANHTENERQVLFSCSRRNEYQEDCLSTLALEETNQYMHGRLSLLGEVASFLVQGLEDHASRGEYVYDCKNGEHNVCYLSIRDSDGYQAGIVIVDGNTARNLTLSRYDFLKLSQTTLTHSEDDPAWDQETHAYLGVPGSPAINPQEVDHLYGLGGKSNREWFDPERYESNICWPLYNIIMVRWQDGVASRMGIGKIHIHAFDAAEPKEMRFSLG